MNYHIINNIWTLQQATLNFCRPYFAHPVLQHVGILSKTVEKGQRQTVAENIWIFVTSKQQ